MREPRLLVSVFNPEEVRAAIQGGADIIDCEDPRADVGMFEPRVLTNISHAVRQMKNQKLIRTSANIGFSLQLFESNSSGMAVPKTIIETKAKAAQEALGLACSMDVGDEQPNIIKFGINGLKSEYAKDIVSAIKNAMSHHYKYQNHQIIGSFLEIDMDEWESRKKDSKIIESLLKLNEYYFSKNGSIDLNNYFSARRVKELMKKSKVNHSRVELINPINPVTMGYAANIEERMRFYVDLIADSGADGVMIDTSIQAKVARICLVKHPSNKKDISKRIGMNRHGIFSIDLLEKFADYCAYKNIEAWLAGSIQSYHAKELGKIKNLDVVLCRGAASDIVFNPYNKNSSGDEKSQRRITYKKVKLMSSNLKLQSKK